MKNQGWVWRVYKFIFLDFWHRRFFHLPIEPRTVDFSAKQKDEYLKSLNLKITLLDKDRSLLKNLPPTPTLYYGDHPSTLDALFVYFALFSKQPWTVSFLHNKLHLAFLKNRTIPVGARFTAQEPTPLGLKMKLACRLEDLSAEECLAMNRAVPEVVTDKLLSGQDVVIFPSGGWGDWQDGIGYALDNLYQKQPNFQLTIQPFKLISFRELHAVLHGWLHILGWRVKGEVKIKFGQSHDLKQIKNLPAMKSSDKKSRAKAIRAWLENDYRNL